jgi:hypothetical protein
MQSRARRADYSLVDAAIALERIVDDPTLHVHLGNRAAIKQSGHLALHAFRRERIAISPPPTPGLIATGDNKKLYA